MDYSNKEDMLHQIPEEAYDLVLQLKGIESKRQTQLIANELLTQRYLKGVFESSVPFKSTYEEAFAFSIQILEKAVRVSIISNANIPWYDKHKKLSSDFVTYTN